MVMEGPVKKGSGGQKSVGRVVEGLSVSDILQLTSPYLRLTCFICYYVFS